MSRSRRPLDYTLPAQVLEGRLLFLPSLFLVFLQTVVSVALASLRERISLALSFSSRQGEAERVCLCAGTPSPFAARTSLPGSEGTRLRTLALTSGLDSWFSGLFLDMLVPCGGEEGEERGRIQ